MLFAYLLDLLISKHTAGLSRLLLLPIQFVLVGTLSSRSVLFAFFLFDFERGSTSPVLGKCFRASLASCAKSTTWTLVGLCLYELITVDQSLLPALVVLSSGKVAHSSSLADLIVNLLNIGVSF